jgi:hypothetical protein
MDIIAHGLWAAAGAVALGRKRPLRHGRTLAIVGLAVAPDLAQLLPLAGAALIGGAGWGVLWAYGSAVPGTEPVLSPLLALWTHHLHCTLHSAVVAAIVTALAWVLTRGFWLPLAGWWSHIAIDVFTHSADFYPVPVLYPFTQRGFDGVAWNTPAFMLANYAALAATAAALYLTREGRNRPG